MICKREQFIQTRQYAFSKYIKNNLDTVEVSMIAWPLASFPVSKLPFQTNEPQQKMNVIHRTS